MVIETGDLPNTCGVYLFKDLEENVIYVGKAVDIKSRVMSHFLDNRSQKEKILKHSTASVDWISTGTELEALILEDTLIKRHQPRYNVRLKDDKSYPYIVITREKYPSILHVRGINREQGDHYGPHGDPRTVRRSMRWLRRIFPVRSCTRDLSRKSRPCLEYHLGRCLGPCKGDVQPDDYSEAVEGLRKFLQGKSSKLVTELEGRMWEASSSGNYEKAAIIRDILKGLRRMRQSQKVVMIRGEDCDLISFTEDSRFSSIVNVREGRVTDVVSFSLEVDPLEEQPGSGFLSSFYSVAGHIPPKVIMSPFNIDRYDRTELEHFLSLKRGASVKIRGPRGQEEKELIHMARRNAYIFSRRGSWAVEAEEALLSLKDTLSLRNLPVDIEGFDISHLSGTGTVASMVHFHKGKPKKSEYRRYRIRNAENDDYSSMFEVVQRRFRRLLDNGQGLPDLVLIDGGPGQLKSALDALYELGIGNKPELVSIAKRKEELYVPDRKLPISLPPTDPGLRLLISVRDEAHRFAVSYQRRTRRFDISTLKEVRGIGPVRAKRILSSYRNLAEIRELGPEELSKRCSVPTEVAEELLDRIG